MANALCNTAIFNPASQRQYIEFNVPYVSVYNSDVWYHSMGNEKRMRKTSMTVQMMFLDVFFQQWNLVQYISIQVYLLFSR